MSSTPTVVFLILILSFFAIRTLATYNPIDAVDYITASALSSQSPSEVMSWTCGTACGNLTGYHPYYSHVFNISEDESVAFSMLYHPCKRKFITAFRGTKGLTQLQLELQYRGPVSYELTDIPGALAVGYFYTSYSRIIRQTLLKKIQKAYKSFPKSQFIFTGHSLGAALTTFAAFDAVSSRYVPARQVKVYNFGSPRVGNKVLAQAIEKAIPEFYRIVHWKDIVAHVPLYVRNDVGHCVPNIEPNNADTKNWPVWHVGQEIFYNEDNTKYMVCKESEDKNCANQFEFYQTTWKDHLFYNGRILSEDGNPVDLSLVGYVDVITMIILGLVS